MPPNTTHLTQPFDKGPFAPLKSSWKYECYKFISDNPGKVISNYVFLKLFPVAWMKAMTAQNIISGFRVTGIYPLDRKAIKLPIQPKDSIIAFDTKLSYIPFHGEVEEVGECSFQAPSLSPAPSVSDAPAQTSTDASFSPTQASLSLTDSEASLSPTDETQFTDKEIHIFQRRYENGYDLVDPRYSHWLQIFHPQANNDVADGDPVISDSDHEEYRPSSYTGCLGKFLVYPLEPKNQKVSSFVRGCSQIVNVIVMFPF